MSEEMLEIYVNVVKQKPTAKRKALTRQERAILRKFIVNL